MRLTQQRREQATQDLLEVLGRYGRCHTSALTGTRRFHGERTLSLSQVRALLDAAPEVQKIYCGAGARTWCEWQLVDGAAS